MKLQFTNGYRPRFDQISRILQFLLSQDGRKKIPRTEIISTLGIPDKQVENLTSMMTGFGLVNPRSSTLTDFGRLIIKKDPYFERIESLWIIHYIVSSNPEWVVWYRIINTVVPTQDNYEVKHISSEYFSDLRDNYSERTITEKLPKEVGAVFAAYSRSDFSRLMILKSEETGKFVKTDPVEVPEQVLLFCIHSFKESIYPGSSAMQIRDIQICDRSPGKVLDLSEYEVRTKIETLHDAGLLRLELNANLNQVRFLNSVKAEDILNKIYGG